MKNKIDAKSALLGILVGILTMSTIGAVRPGPVGRLQISGTGNFGLLVDTTTGKVWRCFFSPSGGAHDGERFFAPKLDNLDK